MREWDIGMRLHDVLGAWTDLVRTWTVVAIIIYATEKLT